MENLRPIQMSDLDKLIQKDSKPTIEDLWKIQTNFPPRYRGICLESVEVSGENKRALELMKQFHLGKVENLLLWGAPGTGKTHLACSVPEKSVYQSLAFIRVPEMLLKFQMSVKDHDELEMIEEYRDSGRRYWTDKSIKAKLFDDVGAHRVSDFSLEMFGILLEKYYAECWRGIIFTSNLSPKQILETMGERISSRICGLCEVVEVKGKDRRLE